jgi:hypothetical protein
MTYQVPVSILSEIAQSAPPSYDDVKDERHSRYSGNLFFVSIQVSNLNFSSVSFFFEQLLSHFSPFENVQG